MRCGTDEVLHIGVIEDFGLLGCDAASFSKWLPTFRSNVAPSSSRVLDASA